MPKRRSWEYPECPCCETDVLVDTKGGMNGSTFGGNFQKPGEMESWFICLHCGTEMLEKDPMKQRRKKYQENRRTNAKLEWLTV
jgi:hypothetical protein